MRDPIAVPKAHFVNGHPLVGPWPYGMQTAVFGMGCFWGAERKFWEVCSGRTNHAEVVLVVFDPTVISFEQLLKIFWENHDPTQGNRQGADVGTQYRSTIYYIDEDQKTLAIKTRDAYQPLLTEAHYKTITTEIAPLTDFYYAEDYHQQYLAKNPNGYCGIGGTGISCPVGLVSS